MLKLVYVARASGQIEQLFDYIAADNPMVAQQVYANLLGAIEALAAQPHLGRASERFSGLRELIVPRLPYVVFYRATKDEVRVIAVLHQRRAGTQL